MIRILNKAIDMSQVDFIFFDKGGTLSYQVPHSDGGVDAAVEIMKLLGYDRNPEEFRRDLKVRNKNYKDWSLESCYEDTVEDICTKWLFFDAPDRQKVLENADRLVIMASFAKGSRVMYHETTPLIKELKRRGYRLGLISNTVSLSMVPRELQEADIAGDLEVVVMSSEERLRKPDPEIFLLACRRAGVEPEECVYIGDAPNRDVEGPRRAGFHAVVVVKGKNYDPATDVGPLREPDILTDSLSDLYDLFPSRIRKPRFNGAWMTDIDDTIIPSGVSPDEEWISWISEKIECLSRHRILWIPMSGVAIVKLGPRILFRLPEKLLPGILYYGGDGSQKYYFDQEKHTWTEDASFSRLFTEAQALAVLGREEFLHSFSEEAYERARSVLLEGDFPSEGGILGEMKDLLRQEGYDPEESETYFRGGSVSWMMLGDISADPYREPHAVETRRRLIGYAEKRLADSGYLERFGSVGINVPFPGARGIKFVLMGNDKERGTRDLIRHEGIAPEQILFSGNELFRGGNDNMIRNIPGVTLLSVGEHTDPGEFVVTDGKGVQGYRRWMDNLCRSLDEGRPWAELLEKMRTPTDSI